MLTANQFPAACVRRFLGFLTLVVLFAAPSAVKAQGDWVTTKIEGVDYVSVESIKTFYGFTDLSRSGNEVTLKNGKVRMQLRVGSQECLMNNVKFVFTDKVTSRGNSVLVSRMDLAKLIDPVLRPNFIPNAGNFRTVIIDPGHGGKDPGAVNSLGTESSYVLKVSLMLKTMLEGKGYKVVMTRSTDRFLSLQERVTLANAVLEPAIFISIHFNHGGRNARGIETFTLSPPGVSHYGRGLRSGDMAERTGNQHDSANIALATAVHGMVLHRLGTNTFDRGIKRARFSVLTGVRHPAILFEGGFMSHPYEARLIANERYQKAICVGIVDAVERYRHAVGMRPAGVRP